MNIAVVGTGYVGLVAGVCFADGGHQVTCVDRDEGKIQKLKSGQIPIYEPGLEDLLKKSKERIEFTTDLKTAVEKNQVIFIAVGTPETPDGSADMSPTLSVIEQICKLAKSKKFVVMKSTVPIGTAEHLNKICRNLTSHEIEIISNPEFLKEGAAIDDFLKPDRVVIGCRSEIAKALMSEIYEPYLRNTNPILFMDNASAEMTKYAANAFLSVKISFINELALVADQLGADINDVRRGFTSDSRINPAFFYPGVGFGGSCFPKDVKALVHTGQKVGVAMSVVSAADQVNDRQKLVLVDRMISFFGGSEKLKGKTIAIWGLAFKPRTDDVREAPALAIIKELDRLGVKIQAFDPVAGETAAAASSVKFQIMSHAEDVLKGADALAIVTEWNEFRTPNLALMKSLMKCPVIFDGRNILDPKKVKDAGFQYFCIGRQVLTGDRA
jgi:UDPglucose 6-dehydrogenase